jgi:hypothetical protein
MHRLRPGFERGAKVSDPKLAIFSKFLYSKNDDLVKSLKLRFPVIPAKAGIQYF